MSTLKNRRKTRNTEKNKQIPFATVGKVQVVSHIVVEIDGCNESVLRMTIYAEKTERPNVLLKKVAQNFPIPIIIVTFATD